jgi:hypothetical protein
MTGKPGTAGGNELASVIITLRPHKCCRLRTRAAVIVGDLAPGRSA